MRHKTSQSADTNLAKDIYSSVIEGAQCIGYSRGTCTQQNMTR